MNFHPTDQIWFVSRKSPHVYSLACNVDVHRTFFFNFAILYWFCHISKWIFHRYTCVPHPEPSSLLPPHIIPLGCPSAPAQDSSIMHRTWAGDSFHIWYYTCFNAILPNHPILSLFKLSYQYINTEWLHTQIWVSCLLNYLESMVMTGSALLHGNRRPQRESSCHGAADKCWLSFIITLVLGFHTIK